MQFKLRTSSLPALLAALFLTACATNPPAQQTDRTIKAMDRETADLADITADTRGLLELAGRDNVLVVFDIDNTILAMEQGLGSDQWYEWQKGLDEADRCNPQNVGDRFAVQGALYYASGMRRTQEDGAVRLGNIQDLGVPVISLTSRGQNFRLPTFRELRRNGFSFSYSAIGPAGGYDEPFMPVNNGRLSRYEDGVFFTAGQHKGQTLLALLEKTGHRMPAVIVMVDDKQKNLDAVKETFSALNVPVHAWRYTGEDENVRTFDAEQAAALWKSIKDPLRHIQQELGPDNYDLGSAVPPPECLVRSR